MRVPVPTTMGMTPAARHRSAAVTVVAHIIMIGVDAVGMIITSAAGVLMRVRRRRPGCHGVRVARRVGLGQRGHPS